MAIAEDLLIYGVAYVDENGQRLSPTDMALEMPDGCVMVEMYPGVAGHKWTETRDYAQHRTDDCPACSPVEVLDSSGRRLRVER